MSTKIAVQPLSARASTPAPFAKFTNPDTTAKGEQRAIVPLVGLKTLWINTGTLCNITCVNCYIDSSPTNDRLAYITRAEVLAFLTEIKTDGLGTTEVAFTGGEPFLNPDLIGILDDALTRGFRVLVLTNALLPMQRPKVKASLLSMLQRFGNQLSLRVSLDHYTQKLHEQERGAKTWAKALAGIGWLAENNFNLAIAGRTCWGETTEQALAGYGALVEQQGWGLDVKNANALMLFPEMNDHAQVPEITVDCWGILNKSPASMMCATSRMVVKHKGADSPTVMPCTLIPYDQRFSMGSTLAQSMAADSGMFQDGAVKLCHVNCAKFCVLGGGSCS